MKLLKLSIQRLDIWMTCSVVVPYVIPCFSLLIRIVIYDIIYDTLLMQ